MERQFSVRRIENYQMNSLNIDSIYISHPSGTNGLEQIEEQKIALGSCQSQIEIGGRSNTIQMMNGIHKVESTNL